jgi:GntR family transcriptional regulator
MSAGASDSSTPRTRPAKAAAIRDWLRQGIANGVFRRGARLPSEHQLMEQFAVSRVTARQALDDLRRQGLVESSQGKGYFVRRMAAIHDLERLQSFGEMMAPLGLETRSDVIEIVEIAAPRDVSEAMDLPPKTTVTCITRSRLAGGAAVSLDISFFPVDIGRALAQLDLARNDIFILLEKQLGLELGYADLMIEVAPVEEMHGGVLGVPSGQPVLSIGRSTRDVRGRVVDHERIYARLDAMRFHVRTPRW